MARVPPRLPLREISHVSTPLPSFSGRLIRTNNKLNVLLIALYIASFAALAFTWMRRDIQMTVNDCKSPRLMQNTYVTIMQLTATPRLCANKERQLETVGSTTSPVHMPTSAGTITIPRRRGTHIAEIHCQFTCRIQLILFPTMRLPDIPCLRDVTERQTERKRSTSYRVHPSAPASDLTWSRPHNTYTAITPFLSQFYTSST